MWGGRCERFDLSLFLRTNCAVTPGGAEGKPFFIMNMQTGPRTWSGEITPFGSNGNTADPKPYGEDRNAEVPLGMTISGEDEMGNSWDCLDIFKANTNGEPTLKDGITYFGPPATGGCTGCLNSRGPCKDPNTNVCYPSSTAGCPNPPCCPGKTVKCP